MFYHLHTHVLQDDDLGCLQFVAISHPNMHIVYFEQNFFFFLRKKKMLFAIAVGCIEK